MSRIRGLALVPRHEAALSYKPADVSCVSFSRASNRIQPQRNALWSDFEPVDELRVIAKLCSTSRGPRDEQLLFREVTRVAVVLRGLRQFEIGVELGESPAGRCERVAEQPIAPVDAFNSQQWPCNMVMTLGIVCRHRDGVRLRPSRSYDMRLDSDGSVALVISGASARRHAGVYTCTVTNETGQVSSSARVLVRPDPLASIR